MTLYRIICTLFLISGAQLNGETGIMYYVCDFHSFEERLNVAGWVDCLDEFFFFFPSCSATVLNASPSAHDQSAAAALRRPPAGHLAALRLFLEALRFAQSPPTGGQVEWARTSVKIHRGRNWTHRRARCNPPRKLRCCLFSFSRICCAVSWMRCAGLRFFLPPPTKTEWKSWSQRNESGCTVGVLSSLQTRMGRMQTRLKKTRERRTGIINKQGLPADPRRSFSYFGGC